MESITAKLYSHDQYKKDEHTNVIFELTNHTKQPVHILKWNTPLEGLKSDCLTVNKNSKKIAYDGLLIKRGKPAPADFITLQPGQSVNSKINVGEAYNIASPGKVKVDYKPEELIFFNEEPTEESLAKSLPVAKSKKGREKDRNQARYFHDKGRYHTAITNRRTAQAG